MQDFQLQTKNSDETPECWLLILAGCKYICGPAKFQLQPCQTYIWPAKWVIICIINFTFKKLQETKNENFFIAWYERASPPCINYMQYPWGYAVPVRICITRESYHQYPWVISSVPVRVCITRESYHQYPWVISSVPMRICSTRESYPQYLWGYAVPVSHIISTRESYPQYPWGYAVPVRICITREGSFIHSSFI